MRLRRSLHFVPGANEKMMNKAISLRADALIFDLEDSVTPEAKQAARDAVCAWLDENKGCRQERLVRVNPFDSEWGRDDLEKIVQHQPDAIVLPKVLSRETVASVDLILQQAEKSLPENFTRPRLILIGTEEAGAVFNLPQMTNHPRVDGLTWGAEDLSVSLGARRKRDLNGNYLEVFGFVRSYCLLAAAAAGVQPIDSVYTDIRDIAGLCRESEIAADMGFTGKLTIHPDQVEVVNAAFTPSAEEIERAGILVRAFDENRREGKMAFTFEGSMVDVPHLKRAEQLLAIAAQIAAQNS